MPLKLKLNTSSRHHAAGIETIQLTVVDDYGKPVVPAQTVQLNGPANLVDLAKLSSTATYVIELKEFDHDA